MSTPRSPNEAGSVILVFGASIAVLVFAWLLVNLGYGVYQLTEWLESLLWP
jgi:hypothetical protein